MLQEFKERANWFIATADSYQYHRAYLDLRDAYLALLQDAVLGADEVQND